MTMNMVLLIDDDEMILAGLQAYLQLENISAMVAVDSESAEAMMKEQFFPLVLSDIRLRNGNDGLHLIESIRRSSPASKIAAMTGFASPQLDLEARAAGAEIVLHKPFLSDDFVLAVKALLSSVKEPEDLEAVYVATAPRLRAMLSRRFDLSHSDCEDLVQQAWCVVLEKRSQVREIGPFLAGTVMNLARQVHTQRRREIELEILPEDVHAFTPDHTPVLAVRNALSKLDQRSRSLCELLGVQKLSYAEVGQKLSLPVGSIGPMYMRAKQLMKTELMN